MKYSFELKKEIYEKYREGYGSDILIYLQMSVKRDACFYTAGN